MSGSVSLIMAVRDRPQFLTEAVRSVVAQTYADWSLLIWDDGSAALTARLCDELALIDSRISTHHAAPVGVWAASRDAYARVGGKYIGCVDSDDVLEPDALRRTVAVLDAFPKVGMVYTSYLEMEADGSNVRPAARSAIPYSPSRMLVDFMTHHFRLIRRTVYEQVGGVDATFTSGGDYDLCLKLSEVTDVAHLDLLLYRYRIHASSISGSRRGEQMRNAKRAVEAAIKRRGLANEIELIVTREKGFTLQKIGDAPTA